MKYEKPQITRMDNALVAVKSLGKVGTPADNNPDPIHCTVPAYEADE